MNLKKGQKKYMKVQIVFQLYLVQLAFRKKKQDIKTNKIIKIILIKKGKI